MYNARSEQTLLHVLRFAIHILATIIVLIFSLVNGQFQDNLHYRLIFDLDKSRRKNEIPGKKNDWLKNVVMCGKYSLTKFANFLIMVLRVHGNCYHFRLKNGLRSGLTQKIPFSSLLLQCLCLHI